MCTELCSSPITTQMLAAHVAPIQQVCRDADVFLIVRPSEKETTTLIGRGFATKNMDIHDKSSNWGLTAGMVPKDPRFCKNGTARNQPVTDGGILNVQHGMSKTTHLQFKPEWLTLIGPGLHFNVKPAVLTASEGSYSCTCGGPVHFPNGMAGQWRHYRSDKAPEFCFLIGPDNKAYWRWAADGPKNAALPANGVPLYVWAYQISGEWLPCTGDYDVWMLAPRIGTKKTDVIKSKPDDYGRSAATDFYSEFLLKLNAACGRSGNKVFHHGAEAQNFSFTQELKPGEAMPVICPGTHAPFMVQPKDVPQLIYQLLQNGYVATINPKWRNGCTLMAEDTGYAMEEKLELTPYGIATAALISQQKKEEDMSAAVDRVKRLGGMDIRNQKGSSATGTEKDAQDALAQVETAAAVSIQRRFRARQAAKKGTGFSAAATDHMRRRLLATEYAYALRVEVNQERKSAAAAIDELNEKFFEGANRGMALMIYNQFSWRDRVGKYRIFREIAKATGGKTFTESETKYPSALFKPLPLLISKARTGEAARREALRQEAAFGRTGFDRHDDGHGHVTITPIDETS